MLKGEISGHMPNNTSKQKNDLRRHHKTCSWMVRLSNSLSKIWIISNVKHSQVRKRMSFNRGAKWIRERGTKFCVHRDFSFAHKSLCNSLMTIATGKLIFKSPLGGHIKYYGNLVSLMYGMQETTYRECILANKLDWAHLQLLCSVKHKGSYAGFRSSTNWFFL